MCPCLILQMLQRLLGLLLSSVCSAMLVPNTTTKQFGEEDGSTVDFNTFYWPGPNEEGSSESSEEKPPWSHIPHDSPPDMPPTGLPWLPSPNMPQDPDSLRRLRLSGPNPDPTICDMLLNTPVPPEQIPFYCLCSHCKGGPGPKGDRGDRGLPGMWIIAVRQEPTMCVCFEVGWVSENANSFH